MRKIDFALHTLLFAFLLIYACINFHAALLVGLFIQLPLGITHLISNGVRLGRAYEFSTATIRLITLYWKLCIGYGILLTLTILFLEEYVFAVIALAWLIALYYYFITYKIAFPKYKRTHLDI